MKQIKKDKQREMKLIKNNIKINFSVPQKELRTAVSKPSYTLIKIKRITFLQKKRKSFKKEKYLNLNSFKNRNAITKARFSSDNLAINTTQRYSLQEDLKNCQNCKKKEIENHKGLSFFDDIQYSITDLVLAAKSSKECTPNHF